MSVCFIFMGGTIIVVVTCYDNVPPPLRCPTVHALKGIFIASVCGEYVRSIETEGGYSHDHKLQF